MISDLDIYRAAQATITRYGDDAALHAAQRADELMAEGDMDGRGVWTGSIAPYATRSPINTDNSGSVYCSPSSKWPPGGGWG